MSGRVALSVLDPSPVPAGGTRMVGDLPAWFTGTARRPNSEPLHVLPAEGADIDVWVLGSSPGVSARTAATRGLPFAHSVRVPADHHVQPSTVLETVAAYREELPPSARADARAGRRPTSCWPPPTTQTAYAAPNCAPTRGGPRSRHESTPTLVEAVMTSTISDLHISWAAWHSAREDELRAPHGWLSLTDLQWLTPEPSAINGLPGLWSATPDGVVIAAAAADGLVVRTVREPRRIDGHVTLHPVDGLPGTLVEVGDKVVEVVRRTDTHALRVRDPEAVTRTAFTGVPTFPVDEHWVLRGRFEPYAEPQPITVGAVVDGLEHHLTAVGVVRFALDGEEHTLVALPGKQGGLSLHFRDATNGDSTYPGGRSVRTEDPAEDGSVTVDLNRLTNLPCAFTDYATCPLPPEGNTLAVAVEAGEKSPLRPDRS